MYNGWWQRHPGRKSTSGYKLYRNKIEIKIHCYTLRHVPGKPLRGSTRSLHQRRVVEKASLFPHPDAFVYRQYPLKPSFLVLEAQPRDSLQSLVLQSNSKTSEEKTCSTLMEWYVRVECCGRLIDHGHSPYKSKFQLSDIVPTIKLLPMASFLLRVVSVKKRKRNFYLANQKQNNYHKFISIK